MSRFVPAVAALAACTLVCLSPAVAQIPVGPQFQVNTFTTSAQSLAAVATDGAGNFVVVWRSFGSAGSDTNVSSIQGQRYDSVGIPLGGEFQVNTYTTSTQDRPAVATDGAGNFVAVWESYGSAGSDTSGFSIQGQRYDSAGAPLGGQFQVNTFTTSAQTAPAVAADGAGRFVVVWESDGSADSDTDGFSVKAQRFDNTGAPVGGEVQVNTFTTSVQRRPAVATDGAGNFVVVWRSFGSAGSDTDSYSIQGQRYNSAGGAVGGEFQVNTYTTGYQLDPAVWADALGNFVVAWQSFGSAGTDTVDGSIHAQRFDGTGTPVGAELQVNTYTTGDALAPAVAADGIGNFVIAWQSDGSAGSDTDGLSIQAQRYDDTGAPVGGQFQVNTYTTNLQMQPAVAGDGTGHSVIVWHSFGSPGTDTSLESVQAQIFGVPTTSSSSTSTSSTSTSSSSTTSTSIPATGLFPGRITVIKPIKLVKFIGKPMPGDIFTLPAANPALTGGSLRVFDAGASAGDDAYALPPGGSATFGWRGLGKPAGSNGYKYRGAGAPGDPCKVVIVKPTVIRGLCKGTDITLTPPFAGDVAIVLNLGGDRYCGRFGGEEARNDAVMTKRKNAVAPGACP